MNESQRIHPVDVESHPTAPLVPTESWRSDKGDPSASPSPSPSAVEYSPQELQQPPVRPTIPDTSSRPPRRRSCWCRCACWTLIILIILIILIGSTIGILFLVFRPKLPRYSIDSLSVSQFGLRNNMSIYAQFNVTITARNPNKRIGIYYRSGSNISVWYQNTSLCSGTFPAFYQGHHNTTVLNIFLNGETDFGSPIMTELQQQQQQTGNIPITLRARVPVRIRLGSWKLPRMRFKARCRLVVDRLTANNAIRIRSSRCRFRLRL